MENIEKIPDFKNDQEISAFMEKHDGFELIDQGLAEIVETPRFTKKTELQLDPETLQLLHELVATGICDDQNEAIVKAVRSYVLAVLPQSYKLVREGQSSISITGDLIGPISITGDLIGP